MYVYLLSGLGKGTWMSTIHPLKASYTVHRAVLVLTEPKSGSNLTKLYEQGQSRKDGKRSMAPNYPPTTHMHTHTQTPSTVYLIAEATGWCTSI